MKASQKRSANADENPKYNGMLEPSRTVAQRMAESCQLMQEV